MRRFAGALAVLCLLLSGCGHPPELADRFSRYVLESPRQEEASGQPASLDPEDAVVPEGSARAAEPPSPEASEEPVPPEASSALPGREAESPSSEAALPESSEPGRESGGADSPEAPASGQLSDPRAQASSGEPAREPAAPPPDAPHSAGTLPEEDYQAQYDLSSELVREEYYLPAIEDEIFQLTNRRRESLGLPVLELSAELRQAARLRSREMFYYNYFEHLRPNGDAWYTALDAMGLPRCHASENIAKGSYEGVPGQSENLLSAAFWQDQWEESPSHYEGIVDPDVTKVGVGFYYVVTDGAVEVYSAVLFADL